MVKISVTVEGMMCGNCEKHVNKAVETAFNVKKVTSDHTKNLTEIIAAEALDEEKLTETITAEGYRVTAVSTEPYEKKGLFF